MKSDDNCKYFKKCGACQLRNMTYEQQLSYKMAKVIKLLGKYCRVDEIVPMENTLGYRNKAQRLIFEQNRRAVPGIYLSSSKRAVRCDMCLVESAVSAKIFAEVCRIMNELGIRAYDPVTKRGAVRQVLVRQAFATGEIMAVVVSAEERLPKEKRFVSLLTERIPQIDTLVLNVNRTDTPLWLTDNERVLFGDGYITDVLCSCSFRISPRSFYQINPVMTEKLYNTALEYAALGGGERVLDAYLGIGTIGITAAKVASEVHAVETNKSAVRDAGQNAKLSGVSNIKFFVGDSAKFIKDAELAGERYDAIFVDPPRAGCDRRFLSGLAHMGMKKIVYVSCNAETLARDMSYLISKGYRVRKIKPFDMFPHTSHVETVAMLSR